MYLTEINKEQELLPVYETLVRRDSWELLSDKSAALLEITGFEVMDKIAQEFSIDRSKIENLVIKLLDKKYKGIEREAKISARDYFIDLVKRGQRDNERFINYLV